jgi:signal transduction histidine kinase
MYDQYIKCKFKLNGIIISLKNTGVPRLTKRKMTPGIVLADLYLMFKKLGKIITILNITGFILVMLVGGTSIYLAKKILNNGYKIEHIGLEINEVDNIRTDALRLLHHIHTFFLTKDPLHSNHANKTVARTRKQIYDYRDHQHDSHRIKTGKEIRLFDIIIENVENLVIVNKILEEFSIAGILDSEKLRRLETVIYTIEATAITINKMHLNQIGEWERDSMTTMQEILILYVLFVLGGGIAVLIGHRLLTKKVVKPIMEVATATSEFSKGTYNKRVYTDSQTEIGKLYQSFNEMAEKLQANDEILRQFNDALEKQVKARTIELEKAHEKLRRTEKIAAIGQIAAGVTHEVKHPLNSLSLSAHSLSKEISEKLGADSSAYTSASLFKHEINRINNILEEFIKFARFPEPQLSKNNINDVVKIAVDVVSECARESGVKVDLSLQENIPLFEFDEGQLEEVLINLTQNAIKATEYSGILKISTANSNGKVIIKVSDDGRGIPESELKKIFSPFFSTDETSLGLGLSIVQRIIESHRGKINCTSTVGEGTVFEITLPINGN